jgi:hypothetical protein
MIKNSQHVICSMGGAWRVRTTGASRAARIFETRREALAYARNGARKEHANVYIHRPDGSVLSRECYGPN